MFKPTAPAKDAAAATAEPPAETATAEPQATHAKSARRKDGWRETFESIVIAFILAFLFRTFEAEAFVIPTGSMAPTLMGAHKDLLCPNCGYRDQAGASSEAEDLARQRGLQGPITPISDVRGAADYRYQLTRNILLKFYHETQAMAETV